MGLARSQMGVVGKGGFGGRRRATSEKEEDRRPDVQELFHRYTADGDLCYEF